MDKRLIKLRIERDRYAFLSRHGHSLFLLAENIQVILAEFDNRP